MLSKGNVKDMYSLSPMQEGMFFHYIMDPKSSAYFEQMSYRVKGGLLPLLFEQSLNRLIRRYDVLRTVFIYKKAAKPRQVLLKTREARIPVEDISHLSEPEQDHYIEVFKERDRETGFELSRDIPLRVSILKLSDSAYEIVWSFHHIIMDGWCTAILIKEMMHFYSRLQEGKEPSLPAAVPYRAYIKWLEKQDREKALHYWRNYLKGYQNRAVVPEIDNVGGSRPRKVSHSFTIDETLTRKLNQISEKNNVTLSTIFQSLWGILLQRYNNSDDVVFGAVVSGRPPGIPGIDTMVGLFINTVPVRIQCRPEDTFAQLVKRVQGRQVAARQYEFVPLAEVQAVTQLKRELLNHIVVFENYPVAREVERTGKKEGSGFEVSNVEVFEQTNYDMDIVVGPGRELHILINYNESVYEMPVIERIEGHLLQIAKQTADDPEVPLETIDILTEAERRLLLYDYNATEVPYPSDKTIHQLFEEQAARTPDRIAVVDHRSYKTYVTYSQLNQTANSTAHRLMERGVAPGDIVGIKMERSIEMIVGIYGILKVGAAYLPIDPHYPQDRIDFMMKDSNAKIVLKPGADSQSKSPLERALEGPRRGTPKGGGVSNLAHSPTSLAYIIYTSGSTGRPKGVMIEHRSVVNRLHWMQQAYPIGEQDVILQKTPVVFDVSVWELFWWSLQGASLCLLEPGGHGNPEAIIEAVVQHRVTTMHF
ncbi:MAG: AMP-binding protein, partial [bacterium]|nr:AMP-binding protein [bacterium]